MAAHLDEEERSQGNKRNGRGKKTLKSSLGSFDIDTPQDRQSSFEPGILKKRQTILADNLSEKIIGLYGLGMSYRDISAHIKEMYDSEISHTVLSQITDRIIPDVKAWQSRPLEPLYCIVWLDAMHYKVKVDGKIKHRALYNVLGINKEGYKDILGIYISRVKELSEKRFVLEKPKNAIKDPYILEFIGLPEHTKYTENDLEQELIDKLEHFLSELGNGFTFVARQKRISFEEKHFRIDLVFFNRILRCFVLIDLKIGEIKHQDLGQMQMYVNYYDREVRLKDENKTIGIVLCKDKSESVVEYTLPENNEQIFASKYQTVLPSKEELKLLINEKKKPTLKAIHICNSQKPAHKPKIAKGYIFANAD